MVFEPKYTKVASSTRNRLGTTQTNIEFKLPIEENIVSVYSVSGNSAITSTDYVGNSINYNGLLDVQVCYDGGAVFATDYNVEFKDKYIAEEDVSGELVVTSNVVDVTATIVNGGLRINAIVEVYFDVITTTEFNVLTGVGEDAYVSTKNIEYSRFVGKSCEKFDVEETVELKNANKILMVTPTVCVRSVEPKDNYALVSGTLNVAICYLKGDAIQDMTTESRAIDFSWEVAFEDLNDNSFIQSAISIVFNEIRVSTTIADGLASVDMYVPVTYCGYVFEKNDLEVIDDLYVESNYMSITSDSINTITGLPSICFGDNISGVASIMETAPFIDEILGVSTNNIVLAGAKVDDGKMIVEGVVNSTVAYYTKETESITTVQVEMPFFVEEKVSVVNASIVTMCLVDVVAKSRRGKEIEVAGELRVFADVYDNETDVVITEVQLGEEKPQEDCSLYIYIVKPGETLWDVAKEMNVSQDLILQQNPDVELPIQTGDRLVIYKPKIMEF